MGCSQVGSMQGRNSVPVWVRVTMTSRGSALYGAVALVRGEVLEFENRFLSCLVYPRIRFILRMVSHRIAWI